MNWFARWRLERAARRYGAALGPQLRKGYGSSRHYTEAQIRTAARKARLDERYIALGLAPFLPPDLFDAASRDAAIRIDRDLAVALYRKHERKRSHETPAEPDGPYDPGINLTP